MRTDSGAWKSRLRQKYRFPSSFSAEEPKEHPKEITIAAAETAENIKSASNENTLDLKYFFLQCRTINEQCRLIYSRMTLMALFDGQSEKLVKVLNYFFLPIQIQLLLFIRPREAI